MAFSKLTNHIDELSDNIQAYATNTVEYYKLNLVKQITKTSSKLVKLLVFGSIFLFFLGFISIAFAFLIGKNIGSYTGGFFIVGGVYLFAFILFYVFGDNFVDNIILHKISKIINEDLDDDDKSAKNQIDE